MIKNNRGVTLISLVLTVLVLGILAGISLDTGGDIVEQVRIGRIVSNMTLVQAKAGPIYEEYQFYNNDANYLVKADANVYTISSMGINLSNDEIAIIAENTGVQASDVSSWSWYKWDQNTLESQGLDKKMLENSECFFVNYEHGEIIFSVGTKFDDSAKYYSISGLDYILKNS